MNGEERLFKLCAQKKKRALEDPHESVGVGSPLELI